MWTKWVVGLLKGGGFVGDVTNPSWPTQRESVCGFTCWMINFEVLGGEEGGRV